MNRLLFTCLFLLTSLSIFSQFTLSGVVTNEEGELIDFASVFLKDSEYATATIQDGSFSIEGVAAGTYQLKASFIGYESYETELELTQDTFLNIVLGGDIFRLEEINIDATRASFETPVTYSILDGETIKNANIAQDVPYMLRWMPSVTVTSDAGAGIGYTGVRVRGSEASRTNVTINGVPLNDSESQNVFWVDLPDFLANVEDIQMQRGVGVSTNGTSAFGATVNLNTQSLRQNTFAILSGAVGSFNTTKYSAHAGTGLLNSKFALEGRVSWIDSDGYVDRASSDLSSYYFSAVRVSEGSSLRFNVFSGGEETYQAWNGLPYSFLETDRTYNTAGTEKAGEPYDKEVDNYRQTHGQIIYNRELGERGTINVTGHMTSGKGYFENYKADQLNSEYKLKPDTVYQDIVIQRWLNNLFYGVIASYEYDTKFLNVVLGAAGNRYDGTHFGDVTWRATDVGEDPKLTRYYTNVAVKNEANSFARLRLNLFNKFYPFVDVQYRYVNYTYEGPDNSGTITDVNENLGFLNPKFGLSYIPHRNHKFFAFYGVANREPSRDEFVGSTPQNRPSHETLYDTELGYVARTKHFDFDLTVFNMNYRDQLVPTGELSDVGEAIRVNVPNSYRRGVELGLLAKPSSRFQLGYYLTLSRNKIEGFTEYVDEWFPPYNQIAVEHADTDIAYSPSQLHTVTSRFSILPLASKNSLDLMLNYKYVGSQFLDNTNSEFAQLEAFSYLDAQLQYSTSFWKVKNMAITLQLNNLLNSKYVSNGWVYRFRAQGNPTDLSDENYSPYNRAEQGDIYNQTGYYPQAGFNFLLGLRFRF